MFLVDLFYRRDCITVDYYNLKKIVLSFPSEINKSVLSAQKQLNKFKSNLTYTSSVVQYVHNIFM